MSYAELQVTSNFSFLRGASHPEELISQAALLGYYAIAITDLHSLSGVVRAHTAAKQHGIKLLIGARLELLFDQGIPTSPTEQTLTILVYPKNRLAYANLCRLLTIGQRRTTKGKCLLTLNDYLEYSNDLVSILVPSYGSNAAHVNFLECAKIIRDSTKEISLAITQNYSANSAFQTQTTIQTSEYLGIPLVATNNVYYHIPGRRPLQDVVTCIRLKCSIYRAGFNLTQNAERYLKSPSEMARLFRDYPAALRRTLEISDLISFTLDELRYEYPHEICPAGKTPHQHLSNLTWQGALQRYPAGAPHKVQDLITKELHLIKELQYEKYFLTCHDIVEFARSRNILCQGRGAAANSAVCYCLGITAVDPNVIDLLFARFISKERNEPPDIDIDFEHERREEVIQYIYQKYGRDRAGLTCEVVTYRHRSALREVGKALGLGLDAVNKIAKSIHRWRSYEIDFKELGLDPNSVTIRNVLRLSQELIGFPRHLSQHVGGFIICEKPLCETVPILNATMPDRTIIEWDKDDIEVLGMLKIDVLGLGMLTCIRKALTFINQTNPELNLELHTIPKEDPAVYDMICASDTIGVFQIESRAQMSMLPRLRPRCFYDLVIEVAIVRPGPIQGNMVHPYLKRRSGLEKAYFPDKRVEEILGKTLGVPLFQEQAMRLAIMLGSFSPGEAEMLRRSMAAWKRNKGAIAAFEKRIVEGMLKNGYTKEFAETCVNQIKGFSEYGFPESHAASFALLVYASAWIKKHYPAQFACALLNSQPMGFYAPAQIVRDAENHGVRLLPIDINKSAWDFTLEHDALRLGMRLVRNLERAQAIMIHQTVTQHGTFSSIEALWKTINKEDNRLRRSSLRALARADAFNSMELDRHEALWHIRALPPVVPLNLVDQEAQAILPFESKQQAMFKDYQATGLSLKAHPVSFIRSYLNTIFVSTAAELKVTRLKTPRNTIVSVAGISIVRQRPSTAKGMVFITLEDETGIVNLIIRPNIFEQYHKAIIGSACILAHGILERVGEVVYINANKITNLDRYM